MVGFKVLQSFYANCGYSVQTFAECKTDRSAVLTVMSGLDLHMINNLKMRINCGSMSFGLFCYKVFLKWIGINLHLVNRHSLIKT
jgi:hypothetical protein